MNKNPGPLPRQAGPGRPKGCQNKMTGYLAARSGWQSPFAILFKIAHNCLECTECRGGKLLEWTTSKGKEAKRKCISCRGTGLEKLKPNEILKAAMELAEYEDAKRRAIEVSGAGGGPVQQAITVEFVNAKPEEVTGVDYFQGQGSQAAQLRYPARAVVQCNRQSR